MCHYYIIVSHSLQGGRPAAPVARVLLGLVVECLSVPWDSSALNAKHAVPSAANRLSLFATESVLLQEASTTVATSASRLPICRIV